MRFIDQVRIEVRAGRGGNGLVAWRREPYVPQGGPAGGDGGRGGDVLLVADDHMSTLLDLKFRQHYKAKSGGPGGNKTKNGKGGDDLVIRVPVGTMVYLEGEAGPPGSPPPWADGDADDVGMEMIYVDGPMPGEGSPEASADDGDISDRAAVLGAQRARPRRGRRGKVFQPKPEVGDVLADLVSPGQTVRVAQGGRGGRGNLHFRSSTNRAPSHAEEGRSGDAYWLRLELKLLADVGLVGFPNVGKSTLISRISRARPRIADYPFTTLVPQLGVVYLGEQRSMVVADVPGLIRGASDGRGLGHDFLRHLERTRVLLHVLSPDLAEDREPLADLEALEQELTRYGTMFAGRPRVVALNKLDTPEGKKLLHKTRAALRARNIPLFPISAQTGEGIPKLLEALWRRVDRTRRSSTQAVAEMPKQAASEQH